MEKSSRWDKQKSATEMARENMHAQKEEQARAEFNRHISAVENENNNIQDCLSSLRGMILTLRHWELHGHDNHYRADIIEILRTAEGAMERYSISMKKQLKGHTDKD